MSNKSNLNSDLGDQSDRKTAFHDLKIRQVKVRKIYIWLVDLHLQVLVQHNHWTTQVDCESLGPSVHVGVPSLIAHAYSKCRGGTVWCQLVTARAVKVEHLSVECLVVWVAIRGTHASICKSINSNFKVATTRNTYLKNNCQAIL